MLRTLVCDSDSGLKKDFTYLNRWCKFLHNALKNRLYAAMVNKFIDNFRVSWKSIFL